MTIGDADDIRAARLDDVQAFFQTYYRPRNASLALAGDVDTDEALGAGDPLLRRLDAGDRPPPVDVSAAVRAMHAERRLLLEDRVELPRLYMSWHSPALFAADDAELDLVAEVLASGKTSRLYRDARLRGAHGDRGGRVAELARARRLFPDRRDRGARTYARRARGGD